MEKIKKEYSSVKFRFSVFVTIFFFSFIFTLTLDALFVPVICVLILLTAGSLAFTFFIARDKSKVEVYKDKVRDLEMTLRIKSRLLAESEDHYSFAKRCFHDRSGQLTNLEKKVDEFRKLLYKKNAEIARIQALYDDKKNEVSYYKCLIEVYENDVRKYRKLASDYEIEYKIKMGPDLFDYCPELCGFCPGKKIKTVFETKPVRKRKIEASIKRKRKKKITGNPDVRVLTAKNRNTPIPAEGR